MLILKKINSQKYSIKGDTSLKQEVVKCLVWKHTHYRKGYMFCPSYVSKSWDGKERLYSPTNIKAGYLEETIDALSNSGVEYSLDGFNNLDFDIKYEEFEKFCKNLIKAVRPKFKEKHNIDLEIRDYQIGAAWKFISQKSEVKLGIALHATSAGKSLMIAFILGFLFYKNMIEKAVIIVPLQSLVTQFYEDLIDYGFKKSFLGKLYSNQKQINRPITIAMTNSTHNMVDTLEGKEFFGNTDIVICDEVHKATAKTVGDSIMRFENAMYFFGCTGTLPESELDKDKIYSMFGQVLDRRKLQELKEEYSAVSNVKIGILKFCYGKKAFLMRLGFNSSIKGWSDEVKFLQNDEFRNDYIIKTISNNFDKNRNIIVLVKNILYGKKIYSLIQKELPISSKKYIFWIDGSMKVDIRDEIINNCRNSKDNYIIVTNFQIFSTGINIPNIDMVFFCDSTKSDITVAQSIGRGVRKSEGKKEVYILDLASDLKYGDRHYRKRKKLYEREGFEVFEKEVNIEDQIPKGLISLKSKS